ncbi:phage tail tape measure protein [Nocardiopsis trehalosi]|uniref:phage tail tape measure protein n=1 Tax=Nocardiopsis trehalosi TaxID=109329 RepID=UPI00083473A0|nr:phage tail tape measure protein [Nocardiopsis trehalosi]
MARANADLSVTLDANTRAFERAINTSRRNLEGLERGVKSAQSSAAVFERELRKAEAAEARLAREAEAAQERRAAAWESAGTAITATSAAISAGIGLAGRAAAQWESDWTGVAKVLDGTPEQMRVLEGQIRDLANVLPATHTEIAATAAAAAQLGVAREYLVGFTATAIALGVTTDLAAEEAAMGLARLSTVMGISHADISRMGSSIVELGNNFAATESEILAMSLRLSGAGNQIGLTAGETMGLATGLTAVGIQAELGGGAFSRSLGRMQSAVMAGGDRLRGFARVAGMSAEEFATAFETRPNEAIVAFLRGLDQVNSSGGDVYATLANLGLTGTEIADVMTRASAAWETVNQAMATGNTGFEENTALIEEAVARYSTVDSQLQLTRNSVNNLGIALGESLLPAMNSVLSHTTAWTNAMADSSDPLLSIASGSAAAVGGVGLLTGAVVLGLPRLMEFHSALSDMGPRGARAASALSSAAGVLGGPWGLAIGAGLVALTLWIDKQAMAEQRTRDFTNALRQDAGEMGANTNQVVANLIAKEDLIAKAEEFGISSDTLVKAMLGEEEALRLVEAALEDENTAYIRAADGGTAASNARAEAARTLQEEVLGTNEALSEAQAQHATEAEVLAVAAETTQGAAAATNELGLATQGLGADLGMAAQQAVDLKAALEALTQTNVDAAVAEYDFAQAVRDAEAAAAENGATLDINTDAGNRNHDALVRLRDQTFQLVQAKYDETGSVDIATAAHERGRKKFIEVARQMGLTERQAEKLADEYLGLEGDVTMAIGVTARGTWTVSESGQVIDPSGRGTNMAFATGGPVFGEGTETSDSIPALLSNNEHVWTAREVRAAGGHGAVEALRRQALAGGHTYAKGGSVRHSRGTGDHVWDQVNDHREDVRLEVQEMIKANLDGIAGEVGTKIRKMMSQGGTGALARAVAQKGVPYSWGGGGPAGPGRGFGRGAGYVGFDCSSLMQYAWWPWVRLPRVTYDQIRSGIPVSRGSERPGDLVFPHKGHVAMYAGGGRLFHTFRTGDVAGYRTMYPSPLAIRRPIPGRAKGGFASGWTVVGEQGPELARFTSPARIYSTQESARVLAGASTGAAAAAPVEHVEYHVHHVPGYSTVQDLQYADERRQRTARVGRPR